MPSTAARKPTNISLNPALIDEARRLRVNISRACERGLETEVAAERARRWREENADAITSSNAFADGEGLPLAALRQF